MKIRVIYMFLLVFLSSRVYAFDVYQIDSAHSSINFKINHLVVATVTGRFDRFSGSFRFDKNTGKLGEIIVSIDAASIDTNEPDRDKHLRGHDFFDVDQFQNISFKANKIESVLNQSAKVYGELIMLGISKPVVLDVTYKGIVVDPWKNKKLVFEASATINRQDWGMRWNKTLDTGGVAVGDEVRITIEGQAVLQGNES